MHIQTVLVDICQLNFRWILDMNKPMHTSMAGPKTRLKIMLGSLIAKLDSRRAVANFRQPDADAGVVDRLVLSYLTNRCVAESRTGFLERWHASFWSGEQGAVFSNNCDHRFQDLFLSKQQPDFLALKAHLQTHPNIDRIVEIGTCSGLFLEFLVNNLPQIRHAIGLDINEAQIAANLKKETSSVIQYFAGDAIHWINDNPAANTLYVSNGGVLEYFARPTLDTLLQGISQSGPAMFYTSEPVANHQGEFTESIPFGDELSFSHNYRDLFESNGYQCHYQRATDFVAGCGSHYRMLVTIASNQ